MATDWISVQQLRENINLIEDLLVQNGPNYPDRPFYEQMLNEQYDELAMVESRQATSSRLPDHHVNLEPPHLARPVSPASSSGASRKRSIGYNAAYPDSKRPSLNPSPMTPNTPNSVISEPTDYRSTYAASSRQPTLNLASERKPAHGYQDSSRQQTLPYGMSRSKQGIVIDLTESNPPTPDPFPELNSAFLAGVTQPIDAFVQEFMPEQDLAQFLIASTSAGTSYAFQQPPPLQQPVVDIPHGAYEIPEVPLYIGNADRPWAPSDNEDEYGAPLTLDEAQAVENLLNNVSAHDAEDAPERRDQTPAIMCSELKEYQKIGLTWLIKVQKSLDTCRGCLLT